MTWMAAVVLLASLVGIAFLSLIAWIKDRFDEMDRDRP